jgi:hypothetical protein
MRARFHNDFLVGATLLFAAALAWQCAVYGQAKQATFKLGPWRCVEIGDGTHVGDSVNCRASDASATQPWMMLSTPARLGVDCTGTSSVRANGLVIKRASDGTIVRVDACAVAEEDGPFVMSNEQPAR